MGRVGIQDPCIRPAGCQGIIRISSLFRGARVGPVSAHWHALEPLRPSLGSMPCATFYAVGGAGQGLGGGSAEGSAEGRLLRVI